MLVSSNPILILYIQADYYRVNAFKKIGNIFSGVILTLVVILVILFAGVRLVGLQVFTVLSGSMEPTYQTGSVIYVKKVDPFTLTTGDVITFMVDAETIATHRIAGIVPDEDDSSVIRFRTKGDANEMEDAKLVHCANVLGKPVFTIPYLGYLIGYIQEPPGKYVAISVAAFLLMLMFLPDLFTEDEEKTGGAEKEKPVREKKPKKEKPVREKKPKKEKPVREKKLPPQMPAPAKKAATAPEPVPKPVPEVVPPIPQKPVSAPEPEEYDLESILAEFRFDD